VCAEELGFESIFYGEHPIRPLDETGQGPHPDGVPLFQDLLVMLARASASTTSLKLGTAVFLVPEHNPVRAAKQIASLDLYSEGRVVLGIGIGWNRTEIEVMGGIFDQRWERTAEAIELMRKLWRDERVEHSSEYFQFPPLQCYPPPHTPGGPPVLIGASGDRALRRVAEYADGWMPALVTPEQVQAAASTIAHGRQRLADYAEHSLLGPRALEICPLIRGDANLRDLVRELEDAGADRVIVSMPFVASLEQAGGALERIASLTLNR
jgi:probable F420-dependent oxidoreductase